jgi:hypothetical protein
MALGQNKLGEAYVDVRARTEQLDADLTQAKNKTEQATAEMGTSAEKNIAKGFKQSISAVTSFVGAVTSIVATFVIFERLGEKIGSVVMAFVRAKDAALEFRRSLRDMNLEQLGKEFDEVAQKTESGFRRVVDWGAQLTDTIGLTEEASQKAKLAAIEAEMADQRRIISLERRNELQREHNKLMAETFDFIPQQGGAEAAGEAMAEAYRAFDKERRQIDADHMRWVGEQVNKMHEERRRNEQKLQDDLKRNAQQYGDALRDALQSAFKAGLSDQSIAGPLDEINRKIDRIARSMRYGGGG